MYFKFHKVHFRAMLYLYNKVLFMLVKAPPRVQYGNKITRVWAILGSKPCPSAFIFILYKRSSALTGLECFLVILLGAFVS